MFRPNTVLARRDDPTKRLRVVGPSPVALMAAAEWEGAGGQAVVVTDADAFGENIPAPIAYLNLRYAIVEEPVPPPPLTFDRPDPISARRTPEEQFAAMERTSISEMARLEEEEAAHAEAERLAVEAAAQAEALVEAREVPTEEEVEELKESLEAVETTDPKPDRMAAARAARAAKKAARDAAKNEEQS